MSDNDSDGDAQPTNNKLGMELQEGINTNGNMFSFKERSRKGSSSCSENDDGDLQRQTSSKHLEPDEQLLANKLSDVLQEAVGSEPNLQFKFSNSRRSDSEIDIVIIGEGNTQQCQKKVEVKQVQTNNTSNEKVEESCEEVQKVKTGITINVQQETVEIKSKQTISVAENKNIENIQQLKDSSKIIMNSNKKQAQIPTPVQPKQQTSKSPEQPIKQIPPIQIPQTTAQIPQKIPQSPTSKISFTPFYPTSTKVPMVIAPKLSQPKNKQEGADEVAKQKQKEKQEQQRYQRQLEDDLAMLKKSQNNHKPKKTSQLEKQKINKTVMPVSKHRDFEQQQAAQTKALQLKVLTTMSQQRKKQNYSRLKEWDKHRAQSLAMHKNTIQLLQSQLDKRIKSSIQNLQIYSTFLREKTKQQQKYLTHPVINTKYALQNNNISKSVYLNCTVILNSLSDQNVIKCRKIQDFVQIVRNDVIRDIIDLHLVQSQKELLRVREKISNLKAALRKHNTETEEKTNQLALCFNENSINLEPDRDFYSTQLDFLQKASQQTATQKKLGEYCLEYLQTAINEQIKRSKVIRQAMITFSKALKQCYNIETDPAEIQQLSKASENRLIEEFYSLEEIFDERCLAVFKAHQNIENSKMLTIDMFSNYLKKFEFQGFDSRMILLKQFQTKYHQISGNKHELQKQQNCYLVITVDRFIHLFLNKQKSDPYCKPDLSFKINMKNLEFKTVKTQMLDLIMKEERRSSMISLFWDTNKNDRIYRLEFPKKDAREEFVDYIAKIRG